MAEPKYTGEVVSGRLPRSEMVAEIKHRPGKYKFDPATNRWDYHLLASRGETVSGLLSVPQMKEAIGGRPGRYVHNYDDDVLDFHLLDSEENKSHYDKFAGYTDNDNDDSSSDEETHYLNSNMTHHTDVKNWLYEDQFDREMLRVGSEESDDESFKEKVAKFDQGWLDKRLDRVHSAHRHRNLLSGGATKDGEAETDHARREQSLESIRNVDPSLSSRRTRSMMPKAIDEMEADRLGNSFSLRMNNDFDEFFGQNIKPELQRVRIRDILRYLSNSGAAREQVRMWEHMLAQVTNEQMAKKTKNWPTSHRFGDDVPGLDPEAVRDTLRKLTEGGMYAYARVYVDDDGSGVNVEYTESFESPFDILKLLVSRDGLDSGDWGITRHPDSDLRLLMQRHGMKTYACHALTDKAVSELKSTFDNTMVPGFRAFGQFYILALADHSPKRPATKNA